MNGELSTRANVWRFPGMMLRVVDGDTIDVELDRGFKTRSEQRLRLYGVDTAETHGVSADSEEYARGTVHKEFVEEWFDRTGGAYLDDPESPDWPLEVLTLKEKGKYGRFLADVATYRGESLVAALFDEFGDEVAYE